MVERLLVIADETDSEPFALSKGMLLAGLTGAAVDVVGFCFEDLSEIADHSGMAEDELRRQLMERQSAAIKKAVSALQQDEEQWSSLDINVDIVWENSVHDWIIRKTGETDYGYVVKTGQPKKQGMFHTPVDWHLIRSSNAPVYLVNEKPWKKKSRLLVALDMEHKNREKSVLNNRLLEQGKKLSEILDLEFECCFVVHVPKILEEFDAIDVSSYTKKAREEYLPEVKKIAESYGIGEENIYREVGDPAKRIMSVANKLKVDVLVIGSMGRSGLARKLRGNTAEAVSRYLHTDMLVINTD